MGTVSWNWLLPLSLSLPHLLYMFIWLKPSLWKKQFRRPVDAFATTALILKVVQGATFLGWYGHARSPAAILDWGQLHAGNVLLALILVGSGQALNLGIFNAIGHVGVYYGTVLGHKVPWVHGFPFNVVSHPQYVGSVLTVWSVPALLWQQRPGGLVPVSLFWTALYALTAVQEAHF